MILGYLMHGNLMPFVDDYCLVGGFKHVVIFHNIWDVCGLRIFGGWCGT